MTSRAAASLRLPSHLMSLPAGLAGTAALYLMLTVGAAASAAPEATASDVQMAVRGMTGARLATAGDLPADMMPSAKATPPTTPRIRTPEPPLPPEQNQAESAPPAPPPPQKPIDNWKEFDAAFATCLDPVPGPEGAEMTLRFALDHKGNLKGKPVASYSKLPGTIAEQKEFVAAALTSLDKCLPLPVTSRFGPIISSRPLLIRFSGPKPRDRGI
ncbi:hypothetical protein [Azorhizobium caulinodans]|uniref:hypothetical protein n=1 Tax=Azorhizobium caulinodans TaxID=7 RepID=UPI002FBE030A